MGHRSFWPAVLLILAFAAPALSERDLTINSISLNGQTSREIKVRPGERILGSVVVSTNSSSLLRTHTGVWLPSWNRTTGAMKVFLNSFGAMENVPVTIDIPAPDVPGTHYISFCFDKRKASEMFQEITSRTDDAIFANGRAIKIIVDPGAVPPARPTSKEAAAPLSTDGTPRSGTTGRGAGHESWWKIDAGSLSSHADDALLIQVNGGMPAIDIDFEVLDAAGNRRGYSEFEGSALESSVVRIFPNEVLFVHLFAFKQNEEAPFTILAKRVSLKSRRSDPSRGRAIAVGDGYAAVGAAGSDQNNQAWYAVPLSSQGSIDVEIKGSLPAKDIDLWLFDELGNARGISREEGSLREHIFVDGLETGTYYVRAGAFRKSDESSFSIKLRVRGGSVPPSGITTDSKLKFPVPYETPFEGIIKISTEDSFLLEIFTGWGEIGKVDSIKLFAPDGALLWSRSAEGRGWEADRIMTRGAGDYRLVITHKEIRKGRIDIAGLRDPHMYFGAASGVPGPGLDQPERDALRRIYDLLNRDGNISASEAELLRKLEEEFSR